jgi:hypothetical protein
MRWASTAVHVAVVLLPIVVLYLVEHSRPGDLLGIWLPWAAIMATVAVTVNLLFQYALRRRSKAAQAVWLLVFLAAAAYCAPAVLKLLRGADGLVCAPITIQGLFCVGYAAVLGRRILRRDGRPFQFRLRTALILTLVLAASSGGYKWSQSRYGGIRSVVADVFVGDLDGMAAVAVGPRGCPDAYIGSVPSEWASIATESFVVQFEGRSFHGRGHGGGWIVDGRQGGLFAAEPYDYGHTEMGFTARYSERERLLSLEYQGHRMTYSRSRKLLVVNGREFKLGEWPLQLVVRRDGEVVMQGEPPRSQGAL